MSSSILILTSEPLPLLGLAASGAGLRAWQLREGLREAGLDAEAVMPLSVARRSWIALEGETAAELPDEIRRHTFPLDDIPGFLAARRPGVLIMQHWGLFDRVGEWDGPLAIDLAGPHILERAFWGGAQPAGDVAQKMAAQRRADFLVCSGRYQRHYFWPFLMQARRAPDALDIPVIPFCWPPAAWSPPALHAARQTKFVYGGMLLPWQDPSRPLVWLLEAMDAAGRGELLFIGGAHPAGDVSRGRFEELMARLEDHPRVRMAGRMAFDDFFQALRGCGWAMDVMAPNAERELAFATRTVIYLAAGLGLLHGDYTEMAPLIERHGAGRTLQPDDEAAIKAAVRDILNGTYSREEAAAGARRLLEQELTTAQHIAPLVEFCRNPKRRTTAAMSSSADAVNTTRGGAANAFGDDGAVAFKLRRELDDTRAELAALRGKAWVRWGERLIGLRPLWAALALLLGCATAPFLFVYLWILGRSKQR